MRKSYLFVVRYKILHILYWVYVAFNIKHTIEFSRGEKNIFNNYDILNDVFFQMVSVYLIIYWLVPKLFYRLKYFQFFISTILTIFAAAVVQMIISELYINLLLPGHVTKSVVISFLSHLIDIGASAVLFLVIILIEHYVKKDLYNKRLEKERLEAELNFLKAQMNPHFMFNALNSIYFLIDQDKEMSKELLIKFSSLLRYQLYECSADKTPLSAEIAFLNDYVDLEKIRNGDGIAVKFLVAEEVNKYEISPLLLIPFVENAFKYVSCFQKTANFIHINCRIDNFNYLTFTVVNSFDLSVKKNHSGGLGIFNVKRRLQLLYPEKHQLTITEENCVFLVSLKIQLS